VEGVTGDVVVVPPDEAAAFTDGVDEEQPTRSNRAPELHTRTARDRERDMPGKVPVGAGKWLAIR